MHIDATYIICKTTGRWKRQRVKIPVTAKLLESLKCLGVTSENIDKHSEIMVMRAKSLAYDMVEESAAAACIMVEHAKLVR